MTTPKPKPGDTRPSRRARGPATTQPSQPLYETQPGMTQRTRPQRAHAEPPSAPPPGGARILLRLMPFAAALALLFVSSTLVGAGSGRRAISVSATSGARVYLDEQYQLALQDIQNGNLELARQRFEFIFTQDQSYTAAAERWVELSLLLNTTATVTPPAAPSATPTLDPRPSEELYTQAAALAASRQWDQTLDVLAALRKTDPGYRVADVDGLIYLALRNRGVDKILNRGELESGIYDFSLAENFGPLDAEAGVYRGWARLYLLGNSFWIAYPEIAAGYYGQLVAVAPNLRDESGLTAFYRYWSSLVQIADQMAGREDWCGAAEGYRAALNAANNNDVAATARAVDELCLALTPSLTPTLTPTALSSATAGISTPTLPATDTATSTAAPDSPTATPTATIPPASPTETATPAPSTETPTSTPSPTETATPGS
ncbi:MAG: hypothetical protein HYZ26_07915 [Chloroflexi bacterium]|nr:hypothetical protein [Chloroflexota bacterium]